MADAELIDLESLDAWIGDRLPGQGKPLDATRLGEGTGIANALYVLRRGDDQWVLRRPPAVKNDPSASDTVREWRILMALEGTLVPHPTPRLLCENLDVLGAPFMIMDVVDGFTPGFHLCAPFADDPQLRWDLAMAYVDGFNLYFGARRGTPHRWRCIVSSRLRKSFSSERRKLTA